MDDHSTLQKMITFSQAEDVVKGRNAVTSQSLGN
jgi:hypothetical protein